MFGNAPSHENARHTPRHTPKTVWPVLLPEGLATMIRAPPPGMSKQTCPVGVPNPMYIIQRSERQSTVLIYFWASTSATTMGPIPVPLTRSAGGVMGRLGASSLCQRTPVPFLGTTPEVQTAEPLPV
mmetsp:Transcript_50345/g.89957  ORF Transcript_50345/g.89957 Transcript_50345/m.89957 type:complete len:127 (+) Transcript_50345:1145-1525(+)